MLRVALLPAASFTVRNAMSLSDFALASFLRAFLVKRAVTPNCPAASFSPLPPASLVLPPGRLRSTTTALQPSSHTTVNRRPFFSALRSFGRAPATKPTTGGVVSPPPPDGGGSPVGGGSSPVGGGSPEGGVV